MNVGFLRRFLSFPFLFLIAGGLVLGSCDSGGVSPDRKLKNGVALSGSENSDVAAVATHREGEWLAAFSRESPGHVSEVVYDTGEGGRATVQLDSEGRPSLAVTGPYVLIFGNYNGGRADVGLVDTESDTIQTFDQIDLGVDFGSLPLPGSDSTGSDSTEISPPQAAKIAGYGSTAFVCAMAAMSVPDAPISGMACQTSGLLQAATGTAEQAGWEDATELIGWGGNTDECADAYGASCVEALTEASETMLEENQEQIDENEQDVAQAYAVVRFGGMWAYREIDRWFVIKENLSYNIEEIEIEDIVNCYYINNLEVIEFDGDIVTYKVQEDNNTFRLQFDRVGPDELTVTRLSDGQEFEWDRAPSQDLQTFFDNECSSSSTARTGTVVSP